jgi:uncharacterized Zn finger protein
MEEGSSAFLGGVIMAGKAPKQANVSAESRWRKLSWEDLEKWAGSRSLQRGQTYQRQNRVQKLAISPEGVLLALVQGSQRYATKVELTGAGKKQRLDSLCTCPVGANGCKHAIAVVLDYLEALKEARPVPVASADDPRWTALEDRDAEMEEDYPDEDWEGDVEDWDEDLDDEDEEAEEDFDQGRSRRKTRQPVPPRRRKGKSKPEDLQAYLEGLPAADLVNYVQRLAQDHPDVARELQDRAALAKGKTGDLIRQLRKDIRRLTAQEAWQNHWSGEGNLPDYGGVQRRFEQLLEMGQADALLELGQLLFTEGQQQVEEAGDEGETATAISACLAVVFRAVPQSSRSDQGKLLYVIDLDLQDEYDLCEGADAILERDWPAAVWSEVADELARRLEALPKPRHNDFFAGYRREKLVTWLITCLENAGREQEVMPLYEAEAQRSGRHDRLVQALIDRGRLDEAKRWALAALEKSETHGRNFAHSLREQLREIAVREKDWPTVAALKAEDFFRNPSVAGLKELEKLAKRVGCEAAVRAAALRFLETGTRPQPAAPPAVTKSTARHSSKKRGPVPAAAAWPLPDPFPTLRSGAKEEHPGTTRPHFDVLLELAIEENRPDDVLAWYEVLSRVKRSSRYGHGYDWFAPRVADAIAATHPDRAIALYRQIIEDHVARTSPSAYEEAVPYLRKLRAVYQKLGQTAEWTNYLVELRTNNTRKRRFLEVLDRLQSKSIIGD